MFRNGDYSIRRKTNCHAVGRHPRVPHAEMDQKMMTNKQTIRIEVIAQADAQTKITLRNRIKGGWPDVIFGTAADTAQFLDPSNGFAADLVKLVLKKIFDGFGEGNGDSLFDSRLYYLKNDLANTVPWYSTELLKELTLTVPATMKEFAGTEMKLQGTGTRRESSATRTTTRRSSSRANAPLRSYRSRTSCGSRRGNRATPGSSIWCRRYSTRECWTSTRASVPASSRMSRRRTKLR